MAQQVNIARRWKAFVPTAQWLPEYQLGWLRLHLIAGITLAAYAMPVSLACAGLAGLPPQVGIYGYLICGLGYALFGSSRQSRWANIGSSDLRMLTFPLLFRDSDRFSVDVQHARARRMASQDGGTTITRGRAARRGT